MSARAKKGSPTIVKKYANRRLYDTGRSSYVTLDDLCEMVKEGHDFIVVDAKSGEDITRSVLTQIIADQEGKGEHILPTNFLKQLIGFYGDSVQSVLPNYLEMMMQNFVQNQDDLKQNMSTFEQMSKQNMAMFEQAIKMFNPAASQGGFNMQDQMDAFQRSMQAMQQNFTNTGKGE